MILLTGGLVFLAVQVFFLICGFCLPQQYGDTFLGELKDKCTRLEETEGKRIVLVGGSGVAFGYDSGLIEKILGDYRAVNFGMYAGLGTRAMLDLSEELIRAGDIVILSPEQDAQTLSDYFNGEFMWQAADGEFGLLKGLKRDSLEQMLGTFPHFALQKLLYVLEGKRPLTDGIYCKSSFNEYGDVETDQCRENIMPLGYDANQPVKFTEDILQEEFVKYMNRYSEKLEKRGAAVWYRFCPVNALAVEQPEAAEEYYAVLQKKLDFPIIGNPQNSVMDAEWFYDTNYHLNSSGKTVNTVQFLRDVKAMLGDSSSLEISLPQKPKADWESGEKTKEIWTADRCAGNTDIEEVFIPESITFMEDYAFDGCTKLKRIVIEQKNPAACLVGQHLLEGTDAKLCVPEDALSCYRLNYSWSVYADRIEAYANR